MRKFLFYIAFLGSLLVITIHILAILGINTVEKISYMLLLDFCLVMILFPALYYFKKDDRLKQNEDIYGLKILVVNKPKGFYSLILALIVYGMFNFLLFFVKTVGKGKIEAKNGIYILHQHGKESKKITKKEYQFFKKNELIMFSAGWICAYSILAIGLYQPKKNINTNLMEEN